MVEHGYKTRPEFCEENELPPQPQSTWEPKDAENTMETQWKGTYQPVSTDINRLNSLKLSYICIKRPHTLWFDWTRSGSYKSMGITCINHDQYISRMSRMWIGSKCGAAWHPTLLGCIYCMSPKCHLRLRWQFQRCDVNVVQVRYGCSVRKQK